jgi:hypothetical protein
MADKNSKAIEEERRKLDNKQCMDCHEKVLSHFITSAFFYCTELIFELFLFQILIKASKFIINIGRGLLMLL